MICRSIQEVTVHLPIRHTLLCETWSPEQTFNPIQLVYRTFNDGALQIFEPAETCAQVLR